MSSTCYVMLCYITCVMLGTIYHVMLYKHNMSCYFIIYVTLCYITYVMSCYITYVLSCYITSVMLCCITYVDSQIASSPVVVLYLVLLDLVNKSFVRRW